jgi:uncharacterized phage infection (PIP) family protein YhgE
LSRVVKAPEHAVLDEMRGVIATLEHRLNHLPSGIDLTQLHSEMQTMVNSHLETLQQQFSSVQEFTQNLDRQQKDLGAWLNRLPQMLDSSALQSQMKYLTTRLEWTETNLADLKNQVSTLEGAADRAQTSNPEYKLVFNLKAAGSQSDILSGSRALLNEALDKATSRVIVVFPYPDRTILDPDLIAKFEAVLDRGCTLDIGWGHLGNLHTEQPSRSFSTN